MAFHREAFGRQLLHVPRAVVHIKHLVATGAVEMVVKPWNRRVSIRTCCLGLCCWPCWAFTSWNVQHCGGITITALTPSKVQLSPQRRISTQI